MRECKRDGINIILWRLHLRGVRENGAPITQKREHNMATGNKKTKESD
jgi:hypothetical protein